MKVKNNHQIKDGSLTSFNNKSSDITNSFRIYFYNRSISLYDIVRVNKDKTRMHSSRMRTARLLTVSHKTRSKYNTESTKSA